MKIFLLCLTMIFSLKAIGAEVSGLIDCNDVCKLRENPTVIFPQQAQLQTVTLSYNFTCNPGIDATSYFPSELHIRDSDGRSITLEYFHASQNFTFSTQGPLVVEDSFPTDMARIIHEPCDLVVHFDAKVHPDVLAEYGKQIDEIERTLPFTYQSYSSGKTVLATVLQNRPRLGCSIYELEGTALHDMTLANYLRSMYHDLYGKEYLAQEYGTPVCSQEIAINLADLTCQNSASLLCVINKTYLDARHELETKDHALAQLMDKVRDPELVARIQSVRARLEFADLRRGHD